jgi:hypothetical protein
MNGELYFGAGKSLDAAKFLGRPNYEVFANQLNQQLPK